MDVTCQEDSLRKRYLFKLFTNLAGFAISLMTMGIVPRGLGPKAYGDYNFLTNFFSQIVGFLDMGTSHCFYTKLSQRPQEKTLVAFYFYFSGIIALIVLGFVIISHVFSVNAWIWPDQGIFFIYLGAGWGLINWMVTVLNSMADAYGLTVATEIIRIIQKIMAMILILWLFFVNKINLVNFYLYYYVILAFLAVAFVWILEKKGHSLRQGWIMPQSQIKSYVKEFYHFSHPLLVYSLIGVIVGIFDRWLLQTFSGSIEQGFFGLSYNIGSVCFLFTQAMSLLLMREFAIAFGKKDMELMARLFRRYIPMLYAVAAYFSCFIAVQADRISFILGGKNFSGAAAAITIMAFFPIHQTYGQLSCNVFFATGQTALYRNIGIAMMVLGLPVTYFFIAPHHLMGLEAGAIGLAVKMVLLQFIGVNVYLYYSARLLKLRFWRYVGHQIVSVGCLVGVALFVRIALERVLPIIHDQIILTFILSGIFYTIIVVLLTYWQPLIFGLTRQDIHSFLMSISKRIKI